MDKKKVKELMEQIDFIAHDFIDGDKQEELQNLVSEVQEELNKSDWISVEDRLPRFGERVYTRITHINGATTYPVTEREKDGETILVRDYHKFVVSCLGCMVTHWKPIEKLEE